MPNILTPSEADKLDLNVASYRTRARAWIFGYGDELLLGYPAGTIFKGDGDAHHYSVERWFAPGVAIPKGESEKVTRQAGDCTEFHFVQEITDADLMHDAKATRGRGVTPDCTFWLESTGDTGDSQWRVAYVMRSGVSVVELMAIKDRLSRPSRAKLMLTKRSFRMKYLRDEIENE